MCIENLGIAVAYGIRYYGQGRITNDNYIQFIRHITLGDEYLKQSQNYVPNMRDLYQGIQSAGGHYEILLKSRRAVLAQVPQKANTDEALKFYQATYGYTEGLRGAIRDLRFRIKAIVVDELVAANRQQAIGITVLISVLIISPVIIFLVRNATMTIKFFSSTIRKKGEELIIERQKAENLLFEILPRKYALNILKKKKNEVQLYDSITVLFCDIEDFHMITEEYAAVELVSYISSLYQILENSVKKYEVFKVDTVNDSAIIICGTEKTDGTLFLNHVSEIGTMALDLIGQASLFTTGKKLKDRLKLRIAVHTGPVLVGILHRPNHLPQFKLYGNTIVIVQNLLQTAEALMIHISAETNSLLEECGGFRTETRGVNLESTGGMETFLLIDKEGGFMNGETIIDNFINQFDFYKSLNS
ncbi:atrial natriuretic peptide receptor 1 isoform X2 [Lepeophtheirus salmonis]|uniref:atrial natriuretic peptide receptor 1 isoform X2 n=1 Tax=Lepeophtheirus salmonis TaxID=72036 RepID=UPI003AF3E7B2